MDNKAGSSGQGAPKQESENLVPCIYYIKPDYDDYGPYHQETINNANDAQFGEILMSPFGPERWEADVEEQKRRKKTEQTNLKMTEGATPQTSAVPSGRQQQIGANGDLAQGMEFPMDEQQGGTSDLPGISPMTPTPPHLFPILKFPEKTKAATKCTGIVKETTPVTHYGVAVPFWPLP
ncbi:UNVERIFIED_CONTAM: hypothetical protein PYX00_008451 [Menopon gallinae]|uniref:Uncharacterized protein n=1 Tax=Menopon gallinae TaxID=328185 RepID=A0AAW2HNF3_9NEOP